MIELNMRNAFLVSTAIHMSVIGLLFSDDIDLVQRIIEEKRPMAVDYFVLTEMDKHPLAPKSQTEIKVIETPKGEGPKIEMKPVPETKPADNITRREPIKKEEALRRTAVKEPAKKQAEIRSTKEYINYFKIIREKIRERLKSNYKNYHGEGDVQTVFILRMDGSLVTAEGVSRANSAPGAALIDIATSSVREASPFPHFPKALSLPQMSFNLTVSFRKE